MTLTPLTPDDVLRLAESSGPKLVVDHLSVHRDIAMAQLVELNADGTDGDTSIFCARFLNGVWQKVDDLAGPASIEMQFGGGSYWGPGSELVFRIPDIVTLTTVVSSRGNWSFVYSDPEGRTVMGTSVVEGPN